MPKMQFNLFDDPEDTLKSWNKKLNYYFGQFDSDDVTVTPFSSNVQVVDTLGHYHSTQVEDAFAEIKSTTMNLASSNLHVDDTGGYYTSTQVEDVFQDIGAMINNSSGDVDITSTGVVNIHADNLILENYIWCTVHISMLAIQKAGLNDPDFAKITDDGAGSQGIYAFKFASNIEEEIFFSFNMPCGYVQDSSGLPHVHWGSTINSTDKVVWGIEYVYRSSDSGVGNSTITSQTVTNTTAGLQESEDSFSYIQFPDYRIHNVYCRVFRDVGSTNDTLVGDAVLYSIGLDVQRDRFGREIL